MSDENNQFPISGDSLNEIVDQSIDADTPLSETALRELALAAGVDPDLVVNHHQEQRDEVRREPAAFSHARIPFVPPKL